MCETLYSNSRTTTKKIKEIKYKEILMQQRLKYTEKLHQLAPLLSLVTLKDQRMFYKEKHMQ